MDLVMELLCLLKAESALIGLKVRDIDHAHLGYGYTRIPNYNVAIDEAKYDRLDDASYRKGMELLRKQNISCIYFMTEYVWRYRRIPVL